MAAAQREGDTHKPRCRARRETGRAHTHRTAPRRAGGQHPAARGGLHGVTRVRASAARRPQSPGRQSPRFRAEMGSGADARHACATQIAEQGPRRGAHRQVCRPLRMDARHASSATVVHGVHPLARFPAGAPLLVCAARGRGAREAEPPPGRATGPRSA